MGEQRLHSALAPIDILTRLELESTLNTKFDAFIRDWYRGEQYVEQNLNASGATSATIPGPDSGYTWSVKLMSAVVSAAATVNFYNSDNTATAPIGVVTLAAAGAAVASFTSNIVTVKDQRNLTITVTGISQPVPAQPAVPASGVAVQNPNTYPVNVTLSGFTATQVFVNGVQVGTGNGTYLVPAGGSISITYTVAGTWVWVNANGLTSAPTIGAVKVTAKQVPTEMEGKL